MCIRDRTYDAVCEAVWGADYYGYENSLNVHIRHLREKIEPDPGHPQWLLTVRGIGYRLTGGGVKLKTFTRMIGRYVLATAAVVLLVVGLLLGAVVYLGLHYGEAADSRVRIGTLAEALIPTADGLQLDPARTPADWLQGYAWAMVLDDDGSVIWQHDLPQNLNKHLSLIHI